MPPGLFPTESSAVHTAPRLRGAVWRAALLALASLARAATPAASEGRASIIGQVRTDSGRVIPSGVKVRLETAEGEPVDQRPANSDGAFELENLPKVRYHLTVTAEGFLPAETDVDLSYASDRVIVNLTLTPIAKRKQFAAALPTLTEMQAPQKARKEYEKGSRALAERNVAEARAHFESAVAAYPCYARAQADLALTLTVQHELPQAEAALKKALSCDAGYVDAYPQLGQLYNLQKKFTKSEAVLQDGLRHTATAWSIYYQLGAAYYGARKYAKAEEAFLRARSLNSNPPSELHVKLADVYLKEGAYDRAYGEMEAYLQADPEGRFASKVKSVMQKLESSGGLASQPPKP